MVPAHCFDAGACAIISPGIARFKYGGMPLTVAVLARIFKSVFPIHRLGVIGLLSRRLFMASLEA